jgi:hypothetical protein
MKKWLTLMVLGTAVAAAGLSSQAALQSAQEPTDAEVEARVDARLHEVMQAVLAGHRSEERTAAIGR